jgi:hypothetical protein
MPAGERAAAVIGYLYQAGFLNDSFVIRKTRLARLQAMPIGEPRVPRTAANAQ